MNLKKIALASAIVGLASLGTTRDASAISLIVFGQTSSSNTVTGTEVAGVTTITTGGAGTQVSISQLDAAAVLPINAFLVLTATSTAPAVAVPGGFAQRFDGSFTITAAPAGLGANYLSGTFTQAVVGGFTGGASMSFVAAQPPEGLTFSSSVIAPADLGLARALTFSFTNVTPPFGVTNNSISSFTATVSGNASGNVTSTVPEPASLLLLGTGLAAAARARRRKTATKA